MYLLNFKIQTLTSESVPKLKLKNINYKTGARFCALESDE